MAEVQFVYYDQFGVQRKSIWDEDDPEKITVHTSVDLTRAVENNHELRELHPRRSTNKLVARGVPLTVAEQAIREQWDDNDWKRWLNDPDNAAFRVWQGRV
jgi:hypothetical protein